MTALGPEPKVSNAAFLYSPGPVGVRVRVRIRIRIRVRF